MTKTSKPWFRRPRLVIPAGLLALGVIAAIVWTVSPWPASLLIRGLFEKGAQDTISEMQPYVPKSGVAAKLDVAYGANENEKLDTFTPKTGADPLPTVVWIHGGAWISGHREDVDPYVKIIASHGYTTVSLDFTGAPEATYPTAITQLNNALAFLVAHADEYRIDPDRIIIAGDSAGAQFSSQLAALTTNPAYAKRLGLTPALSKDQLRAVVLNCGIYDVSGIPDAPGIGGWGFRIALWAYLGDKNWSKTPGGEDMSTLDFVTKDFPQTWISGGNDDPLTPSQSKKLAVRLAELDVPTTPLFYAKDHTPTTPHEYQFHLDSPDAKVALTSTLEFLESVSK